VNVKEEVDKIELKEKILNIVNGRMVINKDDIIKFMKENLGFNYAEEKKKDAQLPSRLKYFKKQDEKKYIKKNCERARYNIENNKLPKS
jgi:hypothetical protein